MNIEDFEITVKKYDREKQVVILNLLACGVLQVRGFRARYGRTKYSPNSSVWIVSPPAIRVGKNYFWIFELQDNELWQQLSEKMIQLAKGYTTTHI
ncbi:MAG: hypothetical protein ACREBJ_06020 [Nitrosotalea sp.]